MKKVLLINSNTEIIPYPVAPLGISLVASSLKGRYDVKILDSAFNTTNKLLDYIERYKPNYIGVSIRNIDNVTMRKCKWYLQEIKDLITNPIKEKFNIPIIIGGSGFSIAPKQMSDFFNVDYGISGEAEDVFPELLTQLDNGINKVQIKGVVSRNQEEFIPRDYEVGKLTIPRANIDYFIDFEPYNNRGSYPIQTKRGCTHKCIYCSYPNIEGKKYRLRSVSNIVDEIEEVQKRIHNVTFEFVDSTFNSPLKHAINICKEIVNRKLKLKLRTMGVNPGDVTEELIVLMKQAGFSQIDCTPDSASEKMIKNYRKNFNKNRLVKCANIIKKHNLPTMWFFMIGAPGETEDTILETFAFIDQYISKEDMVHITEGIRIVPNTDLYDIALKQNVISESNSVIEPMFYVDPDLGKEKLTEILNREIAKRNNVMNSIDTEPSKKLMQAAIKYRKNTDTDEPMFRTLLRIQNQEK